MENRNDGRNQNKSSAPKIQDTVSPGELEEGQAVSLKIAAETELGFKVVINGTIWGVLYYNEVFKDLQVGRTEPGFVKKIRDDGRVDVTLYKTGHQGAEGIDDEIMKALIKAGGFLEVTDKTDAQRIYEMFGVSKKKFKIALGGLYKKRLITIEEDGIRLITKNSSN